ncbi:MAG: ornithine decarboxylase, partial [Candidatus Eisenbacteria bacterium]|nr:ornithine decarboxylase [Candidatus Eisenbacteria bacterium]
MIGTPPDSHLPPTARDAKDLHSLPRARTDSWNRLRDAARRLRRIDRSSSEHARLQQSCQALFEFLDAVEAFHAFPGRPTLRQVRQHFEKGIYEAFSRQTIRLVRLLTTDAYRRLDLSESGVTDYSDLLDVSRLSESVHGRLKQEERPYFEVLLVDDLSPEEEKELRTRLRNLRRPDDGFLYEVVIASTFEDALLAVLINPCIEGCVVRNTFPFPGSSSLDFISNVYELLRVTPAEIDAAMPSERSLILGQLLKKLRPELDLFLVTDAPVEDVAGEPSDAFNRVFYQQEDYLDLHLSILKGIDARFETPFFEALRKYSRKPTGMFHALPISRGRTIARSHWIQDMGRFYGNNIFLAETSATTGGLDSLLQPTGSLKHAQELAARAFGARRTYFVTNGTSTANKIVMQSLVQPGDLVLLAHDCHKSHPYAVILAGALPVYLDAYPLTEYSMYGGVPLREIKRTLLALRREGKLDRVRLLLLTNLTFDGVTYHPERIMREVLAIKPDMIFVWDEAWFAYGRFSPLLRGRTAMEATNRLLAELGSEDYRNRYQAWKKQFDTLDQDDDATWMDQSLWPDPAAARLRVYATQS